MRDLAFLSILGTVVGIWLAVGSLLFGNWGSAFGWLGFCLVCVLIFFSADAIDEKRSQPRARAN